MNKFEYALPVNLADVFHYLDSPGSMIKAGGVDLIDLLKEEIIAPRRLVNLRALDELNFIRENPRTGLQIGPAVILADLADNSVVRNSYRALAQAAAAVASPQIRNLATLGGNLCQRPRCWYFRSNSFTCTRKGGTTCFALDGENQYHAIFGNSDGCAIVHPSGTAVALTALDAGLQISDGKTSRKVPIDNFFVSPAQDVTRENILKPAEAITEIDIPAEMHRYKSYYFKLKEKQSFDWPVADVAVALSMNGGKCTDARIVLGAAAPVPWRVKPAELVLKDKHIDKAVAREAAATAVQGAEPLELNGYKVQIFKTVVYRTICWALDLDPLKD